MSVRWLLMLSGTPVQNNMKELQVGCMGDFC
jgi:SNF2 family DNA or RNA helicase